MERNNQLLLYTTPWAPQGLYSQQLVGAPGDFQALRVRTAGENLTRFVDMLGATALTIPFGELYSALATGVINAVVTLPITLPLVVAVGYDPLWFGIFLVLMVEAAQVTPPVGLNLFVLSGISGKSVGFIAIAALPFFFILLLITALVTVFPEIVLYLPAQMR